jgi:AcrR family transcriptional regulator
MPSSDLRTRRSGIRDRTTVTEEVVDHACGLFARQGLANTSLDQVAYAVSFSKTGLLPSFPTRDSLVAAAMEVIDRHVADIGRRTAGLPLGRERDRVVVAACVDFVLQWPGVAALSQSLVLCDVAPAGMHEQAELVLGALGGTDDENGAARLVDVSCALSGLHTVAQQVALVGRTDEWRDRIIATSMRTLGHDGEGD